VLDVDLDPLGLLNAAALERNAGLVYSAYRVDGARVWIATELGQFTTVLLAWERSPQPAAPSSSAERASGS
jgi:hypothetical protein